MMMIPTAHRITAVTIKTTPNTKTAAPPPRNPAAPEDGRETAGAPFSTPQDVSTATDEPHDGCIVTVVVAALHTLLVAV